MTRKLWIRMSAVITVLALCLSLPGLVPIFAQASAANEPESDMELNVPQQLPADDDSLPQGYQPPRQDDVPAPGTQEHEGDGDPTPGTQEHEGGGDPTPGTQEHEGGGDPTPAPQEPGEGNSDPTPDPQQPGADGGDILSEPHGAGDDTASEEFDEGGTPPVDLDEDGEKPEDLGEAETHPPQEEPEDPLALGVSGLTRSSRPVAGYNVFEVDSYAALAEALRATSYPSEEYPETSVYILLSGDVVIEEEFTLHQSIDKIVIDGDGQHSLSEKNLLRSHVSINTSEVTFKDLTITGNQYYGLFDNIHGTHVRYNYERISYTGPQLLWARQSTAQFTDCAIHITAAGTEANEVAEIRDVVIHGNNQFRHNSPHSVFWLLNNGSLALSDGAKLNINATGANSYILFTGDPQSTLRLEDRASLHIEGTSGQLAGNSGLHSIYLGENAVFEWTAHRTGADYIAVNDSGGAKDAIYLSKGATFRVAPDGTPSSRLIRINGGNVVVGMGASLSLQAILYNAPSASAPFSLAAGSSLTVGDSAILMMDIRNRSNLTSGLLSFDGTASSFHIERDATVVIRGNKATGAVYFGGYGSSMEVNAPNYLEIVTSGGNPIYFNNANAANPCKLTYTDVQQLNYWGSVTNTYLNGGRPVRRWVAQTGALTINATITAAGNGRLSTELTDGALDGQWTSTLDPSQFAWSDARILSAGKIGMEVSADGDAYQGRITAPTMGVPYDQGAVQLRIGQPQADSAGSPRVPAAPDFHVTPSQAVGAGEEIAVWAEYGYVFHNNPPSNLAGERSLTAPDQIEFGVVTIALSDTAVPAVKQYTLHVQDPERSGWQVMASFSGFFNAERSLDGMLVVNNAPLQKTPQRIAASAGTDTVPLDASLLVPGGAAEVGTYAGNITWTLVDAP